MNVFFKWLGRIFLGLVILFLLLPIAIIMCMSFGTGRYLQFPPTGFSLQWYYKLFESPQWISSFWVSLQVASITAVASMLLAIPAAYALQRGRFNGKQFLLIFITLPLVLPTIISAIALYSVFARFHLIGNPLVLAIAHTILALPVVVFPTIAALQRLDKRIEWQAQSLGSSSTQMFRTILIPLLRSTWISVAIFAFVTSFDEVVFALFLGSYNTVTLPKRIWENLRFEIEPTAAAVFTLLLILTTLIVIITIISNRKISEDKPYSFPV